MSDKTGIEWCDATWSPVTGCTKISAGCAHCYIERTPAFRIKGRKFVRGTTDVLCHENRLEQPLHWRKPRRIFVNSLSDLFHEAVPNEFIAEVFHVMYGEASTAPSPKHIYQVLTKRPARMLAWFDWLRDYDGDDATIEALSVFLRLNGPHPRVWLGVSVENQHFADERIPLLLKTPAAVRFISAEPLLSAIDISNFLTADHAANPIRALNTHGQTGSEANSADTLGPASRKAVAKHVGAIRQEAERSAVRNLDWIIVGGESGSGARPFKLEWARDIIRQCHSAKVPCFMKQVGSNPVWWDKAGEYQPKWRFVDRKGGNPSEWPEELRVREFPK